MASDRPMASDRRILIGPDKTFVVAENGPMRLVIRAFHQGRFLMEPALDAAEYAFSCLEQVAGHLPVLKRPATGRPENFPDQPPICRAMCESVKAAGDPDLTPMAAVAGAIADAVADYLFQKIKVGNRSLQDRNQDANIKVIVDNGGDLAIRLSGQETATVGLRPDLNSTDLSHTLALTGEKESYGVNTSGMGGRSFTRGIASAATVLAPLSSTADAAATAIANACFHPDENIVQVAAGQLDPNTDIPRIPVTVQAAALAPETVEKALEAALDKADTLTKSSLIYGAFIVCKNRFALTRPFDYARITPQPDNSLLPL